LLERIAGMPRINWHTVEPNLRIEGLLLVGQSIVAGLAQTFERAAAERIPIAAMRRIMVGDRCSSRIPDKSDAPSIDAGAEPATLLFDTMSATRW
jgi:hypothetical protein